MSRWKNHLVVIILAVLIVSMPIFLVTGYTALYWAWLRADLATALPFLPWARNFGMLAMASAAAALVILFSSKAFPVSPKTRLALSLLATMTIGFFAEFRNEGKFHLKRLVHFFGPGTWVHDGLNSLVSSLGDFLYRFEYSHWNDFLTGPAIVSVLFALVFVKIYAALRNQGATSLSGLTSDTTNLDNSLRFARILMNVGLFWFFIQAWAEKAGYLSSPHSKDEIDLPFEFAGTMLGFWMARVLTRSFDERSEKFQSTFVVDFVSSGVIGLLYTAIVGPLTELIASSVAHGLYAVVPASLEVHQYTSLEQHIRPFELLLLAGAMWWGLNEVSRRDEITVLNGAVDEAEPESKWDLLRTVAKPLAAITAYLVILATMLSLAEPQGPGWTVACALAGLAIGTAALWLVRRTAQKGFTTLLDRNDEGQSQ